MTRGIFTVAELEASAAPLRKRWLIYSREHNGWWRPDGSYTPHVRDAGVYTVETARAILDGANIDRHPDGGPNEFAVPADCLMSRPGDEFEAR